MAAVHVYLFIGTTAELVKLLPVIVEMRRRGIEACCIASGQNNLDASPLWAVAGSSAPDLSLSQAVIRQTALGLFAWFVRTLGSGYLRLRRAGVGRRSGLILVHGDTVSTLMGALLGRALGLRVVHVEAGLRSFKFFRPFPEELCRMLVARLASVAYCPNGWAAGNLARRRAVRVVDTEQNTLLDSMRIALALPPRDDIPVTLPPRYFVAVLHRQENLFDSAFVQAIVGRFRRQARQLPCVFIMHKPSEAALRRLGLYDELKADPDVVVVPRLEYATFTRLLAGSECIATDGGSNQEESYYLGKPCLILRRESERTEGIGLNVVLSGRDLEAVDRFFEAYESYRRPPIDSNVRPATTIVEDLIAMSAANERPIMAPWLS